jgi:hypothetical protein
LPSFSFAFILENYFLPCGRFRFFDDAKVEADMGQIGEIGVKQVRNKRAIVEQ